MKRAAFIVGSLLLVLAPVLYEVAREATMDHAPVPACGWRAFRLFATLAPDGRVTLDWGSAETRPGTRCWDTILVDTCLGDRAWADGRYYDLSRTRLSDIVFRPGRCPSSELE